MFLSVVSALLNRIAIRGWLRAPVIECDKTYLNVTPSKKSLKKARDAIREETGAKKCFKPTPAVVKDLNTFLRGWSGYFDFG